VPPWTSGARPWRRRTRCARGMATCPKGSRSSGPAIHSSLRSIIGKSDLEDLLSDREHLNQGMELMIDSPALDWGVHIERVEVKDVALPDGMKRPMSRQAEAERERRARVLTADGELQASEKPAQAAEVMTEHPAALQLRHLQTVVEVAAEKNSRLVLPFPVELPRFLERKTPPEPIHSERPSAIEGHEAPREPVLLDTLSAGTPTPQPQMSRGCGSFAGSDARAVRLNWVRLTRVPEPAEKAEHERSAKHSLRKARRSSV
jgi:hypothetical protein